ncbi:hypothetical protein CCACVL1_19530 [Corchorus capsularis]|uniref:Uncharacterized protein n=1 Tax=Corchorus capsularis TaxID=210143 RepID=A0A1R3HGG7_COCAP|nr:hypothetical protein CCACVL1_19530 [Corchorus capsularis]
MRETLSVSEKGKGRGGGAYGWKRDSSPEKRSIQLRFSLNTKKKRHGWIFIPKLSDENYPLLQLAFNSASLRFQETQQPSKPKIFKISTLFIAAYDYEEKAVRHQGLASIMQQNQYIHKVKDQVFLFCGIPLSVKDVVNEFFQRLTGAALTI